MQPCSARTIFWKTMALKQAIRCTQSSATTPIRNLNRRGEWTEKIRRRSGCVGNDTPFCTSTITSLKDKRVCSVKSVDSLLAPHSFIPP